MKALLNWLDDRTGYRELLNDALYEPVPGGAKWRYVWGSTLTFVFGLQVITGFCLWSAYSPSAMTAWESVYYIQNVMSFGWLIRGIHHFAAQAMMILLALHFMQVVIDGAYKAPREVNFWLGLILMQIILGLSLTGYLLPWDQKGYYATKVATNIMSATPVVGPQLQQLAQGGPSYGHHTLTRFFSLHAGVLPTLLVVFLALHIYVFRRHGIHAIQAHPEQEGVFWPDQVLKDAVACLGVLATILFFTVWKGAELSGPADPAEAYSAARPEWYFLFLFRFLKFEWVESQGIAFGAIYLPGLLMGVIAVMPILGNWKLGHRFNIGFLAVLLVGVAYLTGIAMIEDARSVEHQAAVTVAERDGHRAVELANEFGIPPLGALELLREDPYTQGPRLFAKNCAACHRFNGHNGMGAPVLASVGGHGVEAKPAPATAADLGNFGSRDWLKQVLTDYPTLFAPLANIDPAEGKVGPKTLADGEMAGWCKENKEALAKPENAESMAALIEFVVAQSGRADLAPFDAKTVAAGQQIFKEGKLKAGTFSSACADCHGLHLIGEGGPLSENTGAAPTLTGYGGPRWMTDFLKNPDHADFYGEKNSMPAFAARLSDRELSLLVRWMTGDYFPSKTAHMK